MRSLGHGLEIQYRKHMEPTPLTYARAKRMRREPTETEAKLWGALRNLSLGGSMFHSHVFILPKLLGSRFDSIMESLP
jgi:very-short-patch-repair endonuclease